MSVFVQNICLFFIFNGKEVAHRGKISVVNGLIFILEAAHAVEH